MFAHQTSTAHKMQLTGCGKIAARSMVDRVVATIQTIAQKSVIVPTAVTLT
jgi:hypothetical protein